MHNNINCEYYICVYNNNIINNNNNIVIIKYVKIFCNM